MDFNIYCKSLGIKKRKFIKKNNKNERKKYSGDFVPYYTITNSRRARML